MKEILAAFFLFLFTSLLGVTLSYADSGKAKKVQEVDFDGSDVDGKTRRPDGSYLVQKRGVDFVPLYNVRKQFDQNIKDSVDSLE